MHTLPHIFLPKSLSVEVPLDAVKAKSLKPMWQKQQVFIL